MLAVNVKEIRVYFEGLDHDDLVKIGFSHINTLKFQVKFDSAITWKNIQSQLCYMKFSLSNVKGCITAGLMLFLSKQLNDCIHNLHSIAIGFPLELSDFEIFSTRNFKPFLKLGSLKFKVFVKKFYIC